MVKSKTELKKPNTRDALLPPEIERQCGIANNIHMKLL